MKYALLKAIDLCKLTQS